MCIKLQDCAPKDIQVQDSIFAKRRVFVGSQAQARDQARDQARNQAQYQAQVQSGDIKVNVNVRLT